MAYKAGMTHITREVDKPGSKAHKKEVCEAVTILECPPMVVVGMVGYIETPRGLWSIATVWPSSPEECHRKCAMCSFGTRKWKFSDHRIPITGLLIPNLVSDLYPSALRGLMNSCNNLLLPSLLSN